jgi:hypothetical protein
MRIIPLGLVISPVGEVQFPAGPSVAQAVAQVISVSIKNHDRVCYRVRRHPAFQLFDQGRIAGG